MAFQVISPEDYLGKQGPSVGSALSNALTRIYQMRDRQLAEEDRKARIALEARRVAAQEEATRRQNAAEARQEFHQARAFDQSELDRGRAASVDSLKGLATESAAPVLSAGQEPIAAPGGGPPGTSEVAQRLTSLVGPEIGPPLAGALEKMIAPEPGAPLIPGVTLPPQVSPRTGASIPTKLAPVQFREDVLAEGQRKQDEAVALERRKEEVKDEFKPAEVRTPSEGEPIYERNKKTGAWELKVPARPKTPTPKDKSGMASDFEGIVRTSPFTGREYMAETDVAPTERKDLSQFARTTKRPYMDKDKSANLEELGRAKADLDAAWSSMKAAFPKNLAGVYGNKALAKVQWGDSGAALKAYQKTKADFGTRVFRATAGAGGLRIQQGLLDKILGSLPDPTTDTLSTGSDAMGRIDTYMKNAEDQAFGTRETKPVQGRDRSADSGAAPLTLAGPPIIVEEQQ